MVELEITYLKNGCGFKARCSACGKLLRYAHGCNNPGLSYAEMGAKEDFEEHIKKCPALKDERIKELEAKVGKCLWTQDEDGIYNTDCDNRFELLAGTPKDNKMKYCPYCGKLID